MFTLCVVFLSSCVWITSCTLFNTCVKKLYNISWSTSYNVSPLSVSKIFNLIQTVFICNPTNFGTSENFRFPFGICNDPSFSSTAISCCFNIIKGNSWGISFPYELTVHFVGKTLFVDSLTIFVEFRLNFDTITGAIIFERLSWTTSSFLFFFNRFSRFNRWTNWIYSWTSWNNTNGNRIDITYRVWIVVSSVISIICSWGNTTSSCRVCNFSSWAW